ncbi:hypothetical protein [Hydrogenobacter hydrogenophilus]|uniref:Uncharacterized protein n=1 Tax=Hydrogenobacter hydrogenophilus TaxID=35835 RepID=A0A285NVZ4_9AQUI|nr:hypothetical protein [Hydrogenobacter hydrogenophilus]SNZ13635.1 hypothetical protein SAMN06265353_0825 [Hydrogenobacter hydrogenophilus]
MSTKGKDFLSFFTSLAVEKGLKFLGVFDRKALLSLEEYLQTDLGTHDPTKSKRPFIGQFIAEKDSYRIVFLTSKVQRIFIDLGNCPSCKNLKPFAFAFRDRRRKRILAYLIPKEVIDHLKFHNCGVCKDFEFLDHLPEEHYE